MKNIQEMSAVVRKQRGDQRICHGLQRSICHGKKESPQPQVNKSCLGGHAGHRPKGDQSGYHMEGEGGGYEFAIPHLIHDDPANNKPETKAGETRAINQTRLEIRKVERMDPVAKDPATNRKSDSCRQDRHEPGKEQTFCIRCNRLITDLNVRHIFLFGGFIAWLGYMVNEGSFTIAPPLSAD